VHERLKRRGETRRPARAGAGSRTVATDARRTGKGVPAGWMLGQIDCLLKCCAVVVQRGTEGELRRSALVWCRTEKGRPMPALRWACDMFAHTAPARDGVLGRKERSVRLATALGCPQSCLVVLRRFKSTPASTSFIISSSRRLELGRQVARKVGGLGSNPCRGRSWSGGCRWACCCAASHF
jgi:hypothetical protein